MDSINDIISSLTPDDINALKSAAESLFGSDKQDTGNFSAALSEALGSKRDSREKTNSNNTDFSNRKSSRNNDNEAHENGQNKFQGSGFRSIPDPGSAFDPAMLGKISKIMSGLNSDGGSRCRLIEALKPNLSSERQKKADEAMQMLKLLELLPLLEGFMDKK